MFKENTPLWLIYLTAIIFFIIFMLDSIILILEIKDMFLNQKMFRIVFDLCVIALAGYLFLYSVKDIKQRWR